jgi:thiamine-phosphate pyrophosphorylase
MDGLLRMVDANANRAREGLRVVEDAARFVLNDAELAGGLKDLRHALRGALEEAGWPALRLAAARDTPGDVGVGRSSPGEGERAGVRGVVLAAGKRAGEALRVLEECAKTSGGGAAGSIAGLRYRLYELERRVVLRLGAGRGEQWRLCVLISESLCRRPWREVAEAALAGGADCLQLREKSLEDGELLARARWLVEAARRAGGGGNNPARVVINDRADIAILAGADGVHLGQGDMPVSAVRALAGERLLVGVSTHDLGEAERAWRDGADYCGVGAMFTTATKPRATSGEAYLRAYLGDERLRAIPHLAIGGITPGNVGTLAAAGCRGVAVSGVVCGSDDPGAVCAALRAGLGA